MEFETASASRGGRDFASAATVTIPSGACGIVVFVDSLYRASPEVSDREVGERLHASGIGSIVFQLPATIDVLGGETPRENLRSVIDHCASRLAAATSWLTEDSETRRLGVGYLATDGGAAAALIVAAQIRDSVQAVVSLGGRPDLAGEALGWVRAPTVLIVAENDREVLAFNELAFDLLGGEKELDIIHGATHLAESADVAKRVAKLAGDWFSEHLLSVA